jgi:hypothetical protein
MKLCKYSTNLSDLPPENCPYADGSGVTCLAKSLFEEEISQFFYQYMRPQRMMK